MPRKSAAKKAAAAAAKAAEVTKVDAETEPVNVLPSESSKKTKVSTGSKRKAEDAADSQTPSQKAKPDIDLATSVFVSGISYESTEDDLIKFFEKVGHIKRINMPRYHDSGKPRGYAHLDFTTKQEAAAACALDGQVLGNRYLDIKMSHGVNAPPKPLSQSLENGAVKSLRVFVGNLSYESKESEVEQLFKKCGEVSDVRFVFDSATGRMKGFAYVEFATQDGADKAVAMTGTSLHGRSLRADYDIGRIKKSYRGKRPEKDSA